MTNIDDRLPKIDKQFVEKIINEHFSDTQIETLVGNIVKGQISAYIASKTHDIALAKVNELIRHQLYETIMSDDTLKDIKCTSRATIEKHITNHHIKEHFSDMLTSYYGDIVEPYRLLNCAEKFLSQIKIICEG